MNKTKKLAIAGLLVALCVVCSGLYIPVGASKCFPIQHAVNVLAGVILGPWYAMGMAFATSSIRVMIGTGSLLAFPGSMVGAFCCGLLYKYSKRLSLAFIGETIGTGILGALIAYPVAIFLMSKEAALFAYVLPFIVSSLGGSMISVALILLLKNKLNLGKIKI